MGSEMCIRDSTSRVASSYTPFKPTFSRVAASFTTFKLGLRCWFPSWINRPLLIGWYQLASVKTKRENETNKHRDCIALSLLSFMFTLQSLTETCLFSRTRLHKTKNVQSHHRTVQFCNGLGSHRNLRFSIILERLAGLSPKVLLSQPFRICEAECIQTDLSVHLIWPSTKPSLT